MPTSAPPAHYGLRYEGGALVAPRGADLGGSCIKCGNPDAPHRRQINLWKLPPAAYLALILSLPAFVVIALLVRKKSDHWINLCSPCNAVWSKASDETAWSTIALVGAPAAGLLTALAGMMLPTVLLFTAGPLMGLAGLWVSARKRLTARQIDQHDVRIDGVSEHYVPGALPALPPPPPEGAR